MTEKTKLTYIGAVFDYSGCADGNRIIIKKLLERGYDIRLIAPIGNMGELYREPEMKTFRKILDKNVKKGYKAEVDKGTAISRVIAPDILPLPKEVYHIGSFQWEFESLPPKYLQGAYNANELFLHTEWEKKLFRKEGFNRNITVIPEGINSKAYRPREGTGFEESRCKDKFSFLWIGQWIPRKAPEILLSAFINEFEPDEPVELTLKTWIHNYLNFERELTWINRCLNEYGRILNKDKIGNIYFVNRSFPYKLMPKFYATYDCYVSCARGEGFNRPAIASMSCAKPTIVTDCTGQDWTGDYVYKVKTKGLQKSWGMELINNDLNGLLWHEPDMRHLQYTMRHVYENQEKAFEKGKQAREYIKKHFTWNKVVDQIEKLL